ncbi:MAG: PspC domain-containing protein [Micrococcaceae bacterium]|nr:PspC domain-containing protein [Micrococcaceae bacterium]
MNESSMDNGFFRWVRELGLQRGEDHWVGGVCSGVAQRFGISPILVRGIFVALCFVAGVGLLLYGLAWAFLPGGDGRIHFQEVLAGHWSSGMTGALIFFIVGSVSSPAAFGWWDGGFWTFVVILGVGFLIFARRGRFTGTQRGHGTAEAGYDWPSTPSPTSASDPAGDGHSTQAGPGAGTPSSRGAAATTPLAARSLHRRIPDQDNTNAPKPAADDTADPWDPGTDPEGPAGSTATSAASPIRTSRSGGIHEPLPGTAGTTESVTEEKTMPLPPTDAASSPKPHGSPASPRATPAAGFGTPPPGSASFNRTPAPEPAKAPRPPRHKSIPGYAATIVLGLAVLSFALVTGLEKLGLLALPANAVAVGLAVALIIIALGIIGAAVKNRTGGALVGFGIAALVLALIWGGGSLRENGPYAGFMGISTTDSGTTTNVFHSGEMDLRSYSTITTDTTVKIENVFSSMRLTLPDNIPVIIDSENPFSSMQINGSATQVRNGLTELNPGASGPTLRLQLEGAFNSIEINVPKAEVAP